MNYSIGNNILWMVADGSNVCVDAQRTDCCRDRMDERFSACQTESAYVIDGFSSEFVSDRDAGVERVKCSVCEDRRYMLAVIDLMGTSFDGGIETICELLETDPTLFVVCFSNEDDVLSVRESIELDQRERLFVSATRVNSDCAFHLVSMLADRCLTRSELGRCRVELALSSQAKKEMAEEAEKAGRAKDEFIANISHEVRTPMNAILGFSSLLAQEKLTTAQMRKVSYVRDASRALMKLINRVLDFSKLSTGEIRLRPTTFDLVSTVADALDAARPDICAKNLALRGNIEGNVPKRLFGDKVRFQQIIENLVDNAVKFTEYGDICVNVVVDEESENNIALRVAVADTGVGIPAARQSIVFDAFEQVDGSSTRKYGGVGIGLGICGQLVELLGGRIGFKSVENEGSEFWFVIPFEKQKTSAKTVQDNEAVNWTIASPTYRNAQRNCDKIKHDMDGPYVLVAEDDRLNRALVDTLLAKTACNVDLAADGQEALEMIEKRSYAMVLMDVRMPRMNGLEAIRIIRKREAANEQHVPIVAMTAHTMHGDRERCLRAGADEYLAKPFSQEEFFTTASRYMPEVFDELINGEREKNAISWERSEPDDGMHGAFEAICGARNNADYCSVEVHANELKKLAVRGGVKTVADSAMRVQLAARGKSVERTLAAVDQLRVTLREELVGTVGPNSI